MKIIQIITDSTKWIEVRIVSCVILYIYEITVSYRTKRYILLSFYKRNWELITALISFRRKTTFSILQWLFKDGNLMGAKRSS